MDLVEEVLADPTCTFIFKTPEKIMPPLLKIEEGIFGYNQDQVILKNLNFAIDQDSRLAIVGANGAGKSTILNLMMDNLEIVKGT
jgi:ATP-binding cassette, subfamily F, member 3